MFYKKKNYKGRGKTRFDMPGSWHKARAPDVLYSNAYWTFSSDEPQFVGYNADGTTNGVLMRVPYLDLVAGKSTTENLVGTFPCWASIQVNDPSNPTVLMPYWVNDATTVDLGAGFGSATFNEVYNAGPMNFRQWAQIYRFASVYKTKIVVEFLPAFVQPSEGSQPLVDDLNQDSLRLFYMLRNMTEGDSTTSRALAQIQTVGNPFSWALGVTPTKVEAQSDVKSIPLSSPNTIGGGTKIGATWSLRNQKERNVNYMLKNVLQSNGTGNSAVWESPTDISGTVSVGTAPDTPSYWFQFMLGTHIGRSAFTYSTRFRVHIRYFYKCWDVRPEVVNWKAMMNLATAPRNPSLHPATDEMQVDEDWVPSADESTPSTPLLEQLTREMQLIENAKKVPSSFKKT